MPHLVRDVEGFNAAMASHRPFYWSACGEAPTADELTASPGQVDCPACALVIEEALDTRDDGQDGVDLHAEGDDAPPPEGLDLGDYLDVEEPHPQAAAASTSEPLNPDEGRPEIETPDADGTIHMVQDLLVSIVGADFKPLHDWRLMLSEESPLPDEDRERLLKLEGLATMIGAESLVAWIGSMVADLHAGVQESRRALASELRDATASKEALKSRVAELEESAEALKEALSESETAKDAVKKASSKRKSAKKKTSSRHKPAKKKRKTAKKKADEPDNDGPPVEA